MPTQRQSLAPSPSDSTPPSALSGVPAPCHGLAAVMLECEYLRQRQREADSTTTEQMWKMFQDLPAQGKDQLVAFYGLQGKPDLECAQILLQAQVNYNVDRWKQANQARTERDAKGRVDRLIQVGKSEAMFMLDDLHMHWVSSQLRHITSREIHSLQDSNRESIGPFTAIQLQPGQMALQFLHVPGHWVLLVAQQTSTNLRIFLFDSLSPTRHSATAFPVRSQIISPLFQLFGTSRQHLQVAVLNCQQQPDAVSCGARCIAFATEVALTNNLDDATQRHFDSTHLYQHLGVCMKANTISRFTHRHVAATATIFRTVTIQRPVPLSHPAQPAALQSAWKMTLSQLMHILKVDPVTDIQLHVIHTDISNKMCNLPS
jgi:hypothetical protein